MPVLSNLAGKCLLQKQFDGSTDSKGCENVSVKNKLSSNDAFVDVAVAVAWVCCDALCHFRPSIAANSFSHAAYTAEMDVNFRVVGLLTLEICT